MGAKTATWPTLLDVSRAMDPNGSIAEVAEILNETNEILDDIPWVEGNLPTGHQHNIRTSLPTPSFRLLNQGVVPSKSSTGQIVDGCAIMEDRSHIDVDVANLNGNSPAFRKTEDAAFIEGFNQTFVDTLIYGDISVDQEKFNGLDSRYYTLSSSVTTYTQVIDAGGTGSDNTSIWLIGWSPSKVFCIYPKGSKAGLNFEDRGIQDLLVDTTNGKYLKAYVSWFQWKCGLAIKDYRYVVRIANIDISALETASDSTDTSANLLKLMTQAISKLPNVAGIRPAFYMNNRVQAMLSVKLLDKGNIFLSMEQVQNSPIYRPIPTLKYMGIPCRRVDAITNAETALIS